MNVSVARAALDNPTMRGFVFAFAEPSPPSMRRWGGWRTCEHTGPRARRSRCCGSSTPTDGRCDGRPRPPSGVQPSGVIVTPTPAGRGPARSLHGSTGEPRPFSKELPMPTYSRSLSLAVDQDTAYAYLSQAENLRPTSRGSPM